MENRAWAKWIIIGTATLGLIGFGLDVGFFTVGWVIEGRLQHRLNWCAPAPMDEGITRKQQLAMAWWNRRQRERSREDRA